MSTHGATNPIIHHTHAAGPDSLMCSGTTGFCCFHGDIFLKIADAWTLMWPQANPESCMCGSCAVRAGRNNDYSPMGHVFQLRPLAYVHYSSLIEFFQMHSAP